MKVRAAIQKFGVLNTKPHAAVTHWFDAEVAVYDKKFKEVATIYKEKHVQLMKSAQEVLLAAGLDFSGGPSKAWYKGADLSSMQVKEMWKLAEENLFQGVDSKKLAAGILSFEQAMAVRKADSEAFDFAAIEEDQLIAESEMLAAANAARLTALLLLVLKDCWEEGPAKLANKRAFKKLYDDVDKSSCGQYVPKVLLDKIAQLKPKR